MAWGVPIHIDLQLGEEEGHEVHEVKLLRAYQRASSCKVGGQHGEQKSIKAVRLPSKALGSGPDLHMMKLQVTIAQRFAILLDKCHLCSQTSVSAQGVWHSSLHNGVPVLLGDNRWSFCPRLAERGRI